MWHKWVNPARRAYFCLLLEWGGVKDSPSELCQDFEVTAAQTSGLVNLVFSSQTDFFFSSGTICLLLKPMILTEPAKATAWLLDQGQNCLPAKCGTSSTKILLDSCRVFLEYAKIKQAKERLCWWSELGGKQQKITTSTYKQFTSCRRSWAEIAFKTFFLLVSWISPPSISSSSIKYAFSKLKMMSSSHTF